MILWRLFFWCPPVELLRISNAIEVYCVGVLLTANVADSNECVIGLLSRRGETDKYGP